MKDKACELESTILQALTSGGISGAAREHLTGCESCSELVLSEGWIKRYSSRQLETRPLPDPRLIWITHDVMRSAGRLTQFARMRGGLETAGIALLALAWAVVVAWKWDAVIAVSSGRRAGEIVQALLNAQLLSLQFLTTVVLLVCASLLMALRGVLIDETV